MHETSSWKEIFPALVIVLFITILLAYFIPIISIIIGIFSISIIVWYGQYIHRKNALDFDLYVEKLVEGIEKANFFVLQESPLAIAVFDSENVLRWNNQLFSKWFDCEVNNSKIDNVLPVEEKEALKRQDNGELVFHYQEEVYKVFFRNIILEKKEKENCLLVYVTKITEQVNLQKKYDDSRLAIAYLEFDNYNSVLKGLNDSQRENIKAEVNKIVGAWVDEVNGVYKQYTDDLYLVVMHRRSLQEAVHKEFPLIESMHGIKMGNKFPVTFSIGASCDGKDVVEIGQKAQSCLDMALSRGGDQAAVSFDGNIVFFGGVTMAQEKNTRVGVRSAAIFIKELMFNAETIFVSGHINEDFDSIGAAVGVAKMAKILNKPVFIIVSGESIALEKFNELAKDYEEYESIIMTDNEASELVKPGSLLILVDHHRPMLCAAPKLLEQVSNKIVIDHHRRAEDFIADTLYTYQEPAASSTAELVTELLTYFTDNLDFNRLEATMLYAGIVVDSKNFAVQTGARTFEAAATLRLAGADPSMVRQLFSEDFELVKSRALLFTNMKILPYGIGISSAELPANSNSSVAVAQVADTMLNTDGVAASFVLGQLGDEVIVSARSRGVINVQIIMEELGGGGHQTVAGVKIKGAIIEKLKEQILELVKKQVNVEVKENEPDESDIT